MQVDWHNNVWGTAMNIVSAFNTAASSGPIICFSHLRWDFVVQRPQHLMERFARTRDVVFFEEYIPTDHHLAYFEIHTFKGSSVKAIRPRIPHWWSESDRTQGLSRLLDEVVEFTRMTHPVLWFYTPMMWEIASHLDAQAVVYDCMDELANFKFAPSTIREAEHKLLARSDVVFTGGESLYRSRAERHANIHCYPSSVDVEHFGQARCPNAIPNDQANIPFPRLGYVGVIDERTDLELVSDIARARPDYSFVFVGPLVKISDRDLPRAANIHFLGRKDYSELPSYLSGWNVALMPFAHNDSTKFISPTKTPEYLAAGLPVVSTRITDVVAAYDGLPGVFLVDGKANFVTACDLAYQMSRGARGWLDAVDRKLRQTSWDSTFTAMDALIEKVAFREYHA
jgi:UDP-galactopyranose mutase